MRPTNSNPSPGCSGSRDPAARLAPVSTWEERRQRIKALDHKRYQVQTSTTSYFVWDSEEEKPVYFVQWEMGPESPLSDSAEALNDAIAHAESLNMESS